MKRLIGFLALLCIAATGWADLKVASSESDFKKLYPSIDEYMEREGQKPALRIILMRHGESEGNALGRAAGQSVAVFLTDKGEAQAAETGDYLVQHFKSLDPHIYSSASFRAVQTSVGVAKAWNRHRGGLLDINTSRALLERSYGRLEGIPREQLKPFVDKAGEEFPKLSYEDKLNYRMVPEMETIAQTYQRAYDYLLSLAQDTMKEMGPVTILTVSHGQVQKALFFKQTADNLQVEAPNFAMPNAALLLFELEDGKLVLKAIHSVPYSDKPFLSWA
jgi:probable phosphoglycerate mutase